MASTHTPMRTCIVTRHTCPQDVLLRVVADPQLSADRSAVLGHDVTVIVPDPYRRLSGRGAWITPDSAACHTAVARRAFQRALRLSTPVDASPVIEFLERRDEPGES